jgi:hypothetical protein
MQQASGHVMKILAFLLLAEDKAELKGRGHCRMMCIAMVCRCAEPLACWCGSCVQWQRVVRPCVLSLKHLSSLFYLLYCC